MSLSIHGNLKDNTSPFDRKTATPIVINGDKYPTLETTIKVNTPIAQCIPFKREPWKMAIEASEVDGRWKMLKLTQTLLHKYKHAFWVKKSWK